jgi:hypothetical protein
MKRDPNSVGFNKIYILQHLRPGDRRTGEEIEKIIKYSSMKSEVAVLSELISVTSQQNFFQTLEEIYRVTSSQGMVPYIHFELHGCKEGFELANNLVLWGSLKTPLLKINKITKNNLFISVASCYGAYLFRILNLREPCPFFGYIGPEDSIFPIELETNFSAFFETLLKEGSFDKAIESLNHAVAQTNSHQKYSFLSCYGLFDMQAEKFFNQVNNSKGRNTLINQAIDLNVSRAEKSSASINALRRRAKDLLRTNWSKEEIGKMREVFTHERESI